MHVFAKRGRGDCAPALRFKKKLRRSEYIVFVISRTSGGKSGAYVGRSACRRQC